MSKDKADIEYNNSTRKEKQDKRNPKEKEVSDVED